MRSGAIDDVHQTIMEGPFHLKDDAMTHFCNIFRSKTLHSWATRDAGMHQEGR